MSRKRVAIVASHPIQYQTPWFRALAAEPDVDLTVYFGMLPDATQQGTGFGVAFQWDIPLLEGYTWKLLENARATPRLGTFAGSSTPRIKDEFRRSRPHAAIITGWNALPLLQALWACEQLGIPRIVRGESNAMRPRAWWKSALHRALLSRYDAALVIGRSNREFYAVNGVSADKMFPSLYFVDNDRFESDAERLRPERISLRRAWSIADDAVCFLFAGKLEPKKRVLDLIEALGQVSLRNSRVHLLIAGSGVQLEEARAAATRARLRTTFAGFLNQSEIAKAYVAADCLVLPSDYGETWGLVVNEAMACGLPAVVSDRVGCGPDLVERDVTGATFPFGDTGTLARTLEAIAGDVPRLRRLGASAQERVGAYSVGAAVQGTVQAVHHVTARY